MSSLPCASENLSFSMQSAVAYPADTAACDELAIETTVPDDTEDLWSAWPYCCALNFYENSLESFHQMRESLYSSYYFWSLARANRRSQDCFQQNYWRDWNREASDEQLELHLV